MTTMIEIVKEQRYPTLGDWRFNNDLLLIKVIDTGNDTYNFLIGIHELIEAKLCFEAGITAQIVDNWDMIVWPSLRKTCPICKGKCGSWSDTEPKTFSECYHCKASGTVPEDCEPGEHPDCPYRTQHMIAENIERLLACQLGISWRKYTEDIDEFFLRTFINVTA